MDCTLSAVLGGNQISFHSLCLDDRVFRFFISCMKVGILVVQLASLSCAEFNLGVFLFNDAVF